MIEIQESSSAFTRTANDPGGIGAVSTTGLPVVGEDGWSWAEVEAGKVRDDSVELVDGTDVGAVAAGADEVTG